MCKKSKLDRPDRLAVSSGLIVTCPSGLLMARMTGRGKWDIPKGRIEAGESPLEAALREAFEETGIEFSGYAEQMADMGRHAYIRGKDLHTFRLMLDQPLDLSGCRCLTWRATDAGSLPETDAWEWVGLEEAALRCGKGLRNYLERAGLF